ncbi:MAG: ABC transporter transmembrane domain-containing protein, partial [Pseudomonadota bacterium]|nr:ABC transporter transmembrane domain-containing protein [Pseudomonadota bacterium]
MRVAPWLWPKGEAWARRRVAAALVMLALAKAATVLTPFLYKAVVDALAPAQEAAGGGAGADAGALAAFALVAGPVGLVVAYGGARLMGALFQQLRDVAFARVGQRALRGLARAAIGHVHGLSLRYHIQRRTGALSRVIDRGVKAVDFLLRFLLFSLFPLFIELTLVAVIFLVEFDWRYFLVVLAMIVGYVWFTFSVTEWRVKIRRVMNQEDQDASQKAVDSLLNFETVKYFGAEAREVERYDRSMANYEDAAVKTANSLAFLNGGQ